MDITDTSDDDESVSGLSRNSDVSLIEDICLASLALSFRENKLLVARMKIGIVMSSCCCMKIYFMSIIGCLYWHSISYWIYFLPS